MEILRRELGEENIKRAFEASINQSNFQASYNSYDQLVLRWHICDNSVDILMCLDKTETRTLVDFIEKVRPRGKTLSFDTLNVKDLSEIPF